MSEHSQLLESHLDFLQEVFNIGNGNTARVFSQMLGAKGLRVPDFLSDQLEYEISVRPT